MLKIKLKTKELVSATRPAFSNLLFCVLLKVLIVNRVIPKINIIKNGKVRSKGAGIKAIGPPPLFSNATSTLNNRKKANAPDTKLDMTYVKYRIPFTT